MSYNIIHMIISSYISVHPHTIGHFPYGLGGCEGGRVTVKFLKLLFLFFTMNRVLYFQLAPFWDVPRRNEINTHMVIHKHIIRYK